MESDNYIPLSYISQIGYCKRRTALLMLEQQWQENIETAKGKIEHKNVHEAGIENRNELHVIRGLAVYSRKLELFGFCDEVRFYDDPNGTIISPFDVKASIYPIEYKHGKLRNEEEYEMQLCAQAICMEEMYDCHIDKGAVFYISSHRKKEIDFTEKLRGKVENAAHDLHNLLDRKIIPKAEYSKKCLKCSLKEICMPEIKTDSSGYMKNIISQLKEVNI